MNPLDRFELIGTRMTACDFSEDALVERIKSDGKSGSLDMGFRVVHTVREAAISDGSLGSRSVIEVPFTFQLKSRLRGASDNEEIIDLGTVCEISFVSGFVGRDQADDGDMALFAGCSEIVERTIFWSVRTYVQDFINLTLMRNVQIPWDLMPKKPAKKARKKIAKPKAAKKAGLKSRKEVTSASSRP